MNKSFLFTLVLACAGIFVSVELVTQSASFSVSGEVGCVVGNQGCLKAASSQYASVFGTPISVFGLSFYIAAALLSIIAFFWKNEQDALKKVFFLGSAGSVLYSLFLGTVSIMDGYLCPYCATLYAINFGLCIATFVAYPDRKASGFAGLSSIPTTMAFWSAVLILLASFPSSKFFFIQKQLELRAQGAQEAARKVATKDELKQHLTNIKEDNTDSNVGNGDSKTDQSNEKSDQNATPDNLPPMPKAIAFETRNRPKRGNAAAPITLVEFSDFECPYCQRFGQSLKEALKVSPNGFNYVFKHFPLDNKCNPSIEGDFHKYSCDAAYAMVCAGQEGKEWAMHDLIFDNQRTLEKDSFIKFAQELGIPIDQFKACLISPETKSHVLQDISEGIKAGINGTPAVYLNGMPMAPELDGQKLGQLLNELSGQMK